jgi:transcription elongation GreA/GreB family factor
MADLEVQMKVVIEDGLEDKEEVVKVGSTVKFIFRDGSHISFTVPLKDDAEGVKVSTWGSLIIEPEASNCVTLKTKGC